MVSLQQHHQIQPSWSFFVGPPRIRHTKTIIDPQSEVRSPLAADALCCSASHEAAPRRKRQGAPAARKVPPKSSSRTSLHHQAGLKDSSISSKRPSKNKKSTYRTEKCGSCKQGSPLSVPAGLHLEKLLEPNCCLTCQSQKAPSKIRRERTARGLMPALENQCWSPGFETDTLVDSFLKNPVRGPSNAPGSMHVSLQRRSPSGPFGGGTYSAGGLQAPVSLTMDVRLGIRQKSRHGRSLVHTSWQSFPLSSSSEAPIGTFGKTAPASCSLESAETTVAHEASTDRERWHATPGVRATSLQSHRSRCSRTRKGKAAVFSREVRGEEMRLQLPCLGEVTVPKPALLNHVEMNIRRLCCTFNHSDSRFESTAATAQHHYPQQHHYHYIQKQDRAVCTEDLGDLPHEEEGDELLQSECNSQGSEGSLWGGPFKGAPLRNTPEDEGLSEAHSLESFGSIYGPAPLICPF